MNRLASTADELFTWIVLMAILAVLVSTKSSGTLIKDLGNAIASLTAIVVNPVSGSQNVIK
jgi:hypothetical protein